MLNREIMSTAIVDCLPETSLEAAAKLMADSGCGALVVVDHLQQRRLLGIITDRDIITRGVAKGLDPVTATVAACMSAPVVSVGQGDEVERTCRLLAEHQIRRIPVIDEDGTCCGMVAQADIARFAPADLTAQLVKEVSTPSSLGR